MVVPGAGHSDVRLSVPTTPAAPGSHIDAGKHTASSSVSNLLNGCAVAGLRATASVTPLATTGWGPVYDSVPDTYSFALAPQQEEDE